MGHAGGCGFGDSAAAPGAEGQAADWHRGHARVCPPPDSGLAAKRTGATQEARCEPAPGAYSRPRSFLACLRLSSRAPRKLSRSIYKLRSTRRLLTRSSPAHLCASGLPGHVPLRVTVHYVNSARRAAFRRACWALAGLKMLQRIVKLLQGQCLHGVQQTYLLRQSTCLHDRTVRLRDRKR